MFFRLADRFMTRPSDRPWLFCLPVLLLFAACDASPARPPALRLVGSSEASGSFEDGKRLLVQGRAAEAVSVFRAVLRREGRTLSVLNGLAIAYAELGRSDLAVRFFGEALAIAPDDPATLNNIGFAALRRDEIGLARHYFEKAERQEQAYAEIAGNLAALDRIEARPSRRRTSAHAARASLDSALFTVDRKARQVQAVSLRPAIRREAGTPPIPAPRPASVEAGALIDFTGLLDPWSKTPFGIDSEGASRESVSHMRPSESGAS